MQITQAICGYIRGLWLLAETFPGLLSAGGFRSVSHFAAIVITYFLFAYGTILMASNLCSGSLALGLSPPSVWVEA